MHRAAAEGWLSEIRTARRIQRRELAGVKARWHDLRHTAVTRLLENGQTLPVVASIMGWSPSTTVRMAQRYGHISTDARRAAMESMNAPRLKLTEARFDDDAAMAAKGGAVHKRARHPRPSNEYRAGRVLAGTSGS